ncbi:MAG TPA: YceI family protein [Puia sp.]|nr:YceI family protein [Puia sp.]
MTFKLMGATVIFMAGLALAGNWQSDPATAKIAFSVKGPFGTVNGSFSGLKSEIRFDQKDLSGSSISASIDPKTVNTGIGLRNRHLRNEEEWFNTDKYPEITFHATKIEKTDNGYKALGELTLKGTTKPAAISFTFTSNGDTGLFKGQFTLKREDFNLGKPGGSVGSIVTLNLEVPVKK